MPWRNPKLSPGERYRLRYAVDPEFAVAERVRSRFRQRRRFSNIAYILRKAVQGRVTTPSIEAFLGYTMADLRAHLEARFTEGMGWPAFARGEIHIDHCRPVKFFDLNTAEGLRACWAMENLQPLWAAENLRKGARLAA